MKIDNKKIKRIIKAVAVTGVLVFLSVSAQASEITPDNIIQYVNLARQAQGTDILVANDKLMRIAEDKLNDMIANKYFAHTSPTGVSPWHWFQKEGYDYHFAGENLAINFKTAESQQAAWMASPAHQKNILDKKFQEIGVAVGIQESDGQTSIVAVQEFGTTFAGTPVEEKKFSPLKDTDLEKDDGRIVPQVLSVKRTAPEQTIPIGPQNGGQTGVLNQFENDQTEMLNRIFLAVMFLLVLSISFTALAFLAVAADKLWVIQMAHRKKAPTVI